jgi:hypothetical protein
VTGGSPEMVQRGPRGPGSQLPFFGLHTVPVGQETKVQRLESASLSVSDACACDSSAPVPPHAPSRAASEMPIAAAKPWLARRGRSLRFMRSSLLLR